MLKTDYSGVFERKFQKLRQQGASGYNTPELYQDSFAKVTNVSQQLESATLLELGCGAGDLSLLLSEKGFQTYGIDISPTAIAWAEENREEQNLRADFRVGNVLDLPYEDGFFDVIIDALCLHCIIGEDRIAFLKNVHRVLKSQGLFIVMSKCGEPKEADYPFDSVTRCKIENGIATRYWGLPESLVQEVETAGFEIFKWEALAEAGIVCSRPVLDLTEDRAVQIADIREGILGDLAGCRVLCLATRGGLGGICRGENAAGNWLLRR